MATKFSPCKGSYVLNQFPSNVMFGMNGFHVSASGAIQGHHGPLVISCHFIWRLLPKQKLLFSCLYNACSKPFPKRQILDSSKLRVFADDNFIFDENGGEFYKWIENTEGKGEIACNEQILLFQQCIQDLYYRQNQGLFGQGII